jgi:hypothetical protein
VKQWTLGPKLQRQRAGEANQQIIKSSNSLIIIFANKQETTNERKAKSGT